jgi:uncharacterized membrane protein YfcA
MTGPGHARQLHVVLFIALAAVAPPALAAAATASATAWWVWPIALLVVCFLLGIVAVPAGIGGGVLFVPIVGSFFPFDLDFVRSAGMLVALASALAATPNLLLRGIADLRLALPLALSASIGSVAGALLGLALPASVLQVALGLVILGVVGLMIATRNAEVPAVPVGGGRWSSLGIGGSFYDPARGVDVAWSAHRIPLGTAAFAVNGLVGGMFGVGAGWANVPTLTLLMGAPLKIAVGTSSVILSIASSSAIWTYVNAGTVLPLVAAPAMIGMMLGARVGARLLAVLKAGVIRRLVIVLLLVAGIRALTRGLGL